MNRGQCVGHLPEACHTHALGPSAVAMSRLTIAMIRLILAMINLIIARINLILIIACSA